MAMREPVRFVSSRMHMRTVRSAGGLYAGGNALAGYP